MQLQKLFGEYDSYIVINKWKWLTERNIRFK